MSQGLYRSVNLYHVTLTFKLPYRRRLWKTLWEKEKMLVTSIFSFSHIVFYSIKDRNPHFRNIQFVVCMCFQFGLIQDFVVWERVTAKYCTNVSKIFKCMNLLGYLCPTWVAQWWACQTPDLVVVSSIPSWGEISFWHIAPHLGWSMWEKSSRWLWKEICVSTGGRKPGNACASPTAMIWP